MAQVGVEPTASQGLSLSGLPVAYRAISFRCPRWESNPQSPGFKPGRSADWRTRATALRGRFVQVEGALKTSQSPASALRSRASPLGGANSLPLLTDRWLAPSPPDRRRRRSLAGFPRVATLGLSISCLYAPHGGARSGRAGLQLRGQESNLRVPASEAGVAIQQLPPRRWFHRRSHPLEVRGEGVEPSPGDSKAPGLPLADPRNGPNSSQRTAKPTVGSEGLEPSPPG